MQHGGPALRPVPGAAIALAIRGAAAAASSLQRDEASIGVKPADFASESRRKANIPERHPHFSAKGPFWGIPQDLLSSGSSSSTGANSALS